MRRQSAAQLLAIFAIVGAVAYLVVTVAWAQISVTQNDQSRYEAAGIGINIGENTNYGGKYLLSNLLAANNPGFQKTLWSQVETVASGTKTSFITTNQYDLLPAGWYKNGRFYVSCHGGQIRDGVQVCTGGAYHCTGTISTNTAAAGGSGPTFRLATACPAALAANDTVNVYVAAPSSRINAADFGWSAVTTGAGRVSIDTSPPDQPPAIYRVDGLDGFRGTQCLKLDTGAQPGSTAAVETYIDQADGPGNFYRFTGAYTQSVMAKTLSGSSLVLTFYGSRKGGASWSQQVTPAKSWGMLSSTFTPSPENASTPQGAVIVGIKLSGRGSVCLARASLRSTADTGIYRAQVATDISQVLNAGEIRYSASESGDTLENMIAPQAYRSPAGASDDARPYVYQPGTQQGLHDFLAGMAAMGRKKVWISVPPTWLASQDAPHLVDYLFGSRSTTWGGKRAALGQISPWSSVFNRIVIEFGGEVWSSTTGREGSVMPQYAVGETPAWNYLPLLVEWCSALKADSNWNRSVGKCAGGFRTAPATEGFNAKLRTADPNHSVDIEANSEYGAEDVTSCGNPAQWTSAFVEASMGNNFDHNSASGFYQTVTTPGPPVVSGTYAYGNSTTKGSCKQAELDGYANGEGYGLVDALMPLYSNKLFGIEDRDLFTLYQYALPIPGIRKNYIWGVFTGSGGSYNNPRPVAYAVGMTNNCIGSGRGYATTRSDMPTFEYRSTNGVNSESKVPYLHFFGFASGSARCLEVINIDPSHGYTFTVKGTNPPHGNVIQVLYTSANLADTNETSVVVQPRTSRSRDPSSFTIPSKAILTISYQAETGSGGGPHSPIRR